MMECSHVLTCLHAVANNLFLGYWTAESIKGFAQSDYMGTYAALGIGYALFCFGLSYSLT